MASASDQKKNTEKGTDNTASEPGDNIIRRFQEKRRRRKFLEQQRKLVEKQREFVVEPEGYFEGRFVGLETEEMLKRIQEAKENGLTLKLSHTTVALTGSSAAGKTSLLNLLSRQKFTAHHHSTNVAESKQVVYTAGVVGSGKESQWIDLSHENMIKKLNAYLSNASIPQPGFFSKLKRRLMVSKQHHGRSSIEHDIAFPYEKESLEDRWKIVNFLDTGGQPEFINLFPTISSSIIVTFIVLNMCGGVKSLDEQVKVIHSKHGVPSYEPYHLHYTNLDLIKLLMTFSKESGIKTKPPLLPTEKKSKSTSAPYQCYVGTHKDKVMPTDIHAIESKLKHTADELKCSRYLWELDKKVLFPVDNTTAGHDEEDPIAGIIRTRIQELVEGGTAYDVPITWLILLLEMQKYSSENGVSYLSYTEIVEICKNGNLIQDKKEVQNALLFFHLMGVLLYYHNVPGMCQYVIINHQWLFEKLTGLVNLTFERKGYDMNAIDKFEKEGILSISLIEQINLEADIDTKCFIALLEHLKVVAKIDKENYFMPCVLHSFKSSMSTILDQYGSIQCVELLVHFVSNPLPRGFFCCLATDICQNLPKNWLVPPHSTEHKQRTYNNLITFQSVTGHSISLIDKIGYLEIQIRHNETSPHISNEVRKFLSKRLYKVCSHLQLKDEQLSYGFPCSCSEIKPHENHIASLPIKLNPIPQYIHCPYGTTMELKHGHLCWLQPPQKSVSVPLQLSDDTLKRDSERNTSQRYSYTTHKQNTLSPKPTFTELIEQLDGVVSWKKVAAFLLSDEDGSKVETIEKNNFYKIEDCRIAMIREYFKSGDVSWKKVLEALTTAGEKATLNKIQHLL